MKIPEGKHFRLFDLVPAQTLNDFGYIEKQLSRRGSRQTESSTYIYLESVHCLREKENIFFPTQASRESVTRLTIPILFLTTIQDKGIENTGLYSKLTASAALWHETSVCPETTHEYQGQYLKDLAFFLPN